MEDLKPLRGARFEPSRDIAEIIRNLISKEAKIPLGQRH